MIILWLIVSCYGGGFVVKLCSTLASPWTVACQASLSIGFSRQEYWSELLFPSPGDLFHPGIKSRSLVLQAYAAILSYEGIPWSCWKVKVKVVQLRRTLCDPFAFLQARILEWIAISFSRGSSRSRNGTRVSCIAGRFFTDWAITESHSLHRS